MQELISITTDGQGSSVVLARDLYRFLGFDAGQWSRWSKKNIAGNFFAEEGRDWYRLDIESNGSTDYALTLDFAKRLSMLARTEKGERIRQYFVECEKVAKTTIPAVGQPATDQAVLELVGRQTQIISSQQMLLEQLRLDVDRLAHSNRPNRPPYAAMKPGMNPPMAMLRPQINQIINDYCEQCSALQSDAYNYLYKRFFDDYGIDVYCLPRAEGASILDAIESRGLIGKLYNLAQREYLPRFN